jgi:hypothetical protein
VDAVTGLGEEDAVGRVLERLEFFLPEVAEDRLEHVLAPALRVVWAEFLVVQRALECRLHNALDVALQREEVTAAIVRL